MNQTERERKFVETLQKEIEDLKKERDHYKRGYQATGYEAWHCPGCKYEDGKFIEYCQLHKVIESLEEENAELREEIMSLELAAGMED